MKAPFTCLIIDDEKPAQRVMETYLSRLPDLFQASYCDSAVEAIALMHEKSFDLLFLDVNMPELSGIEFVKTLTHPPRIVLTTAYSQYAIEAFEQGVIDYLLKPFSFQRFLKAVNRFLELTGVPPSNLGKPPNDPLPGGKFLEIHTESGDQKISLSDILYIQAYGNYLKVNTADGSVLIRETLAHLLGRLPSPPFVQVHRSYVLNVSKAYSIRSNFILLGNLSIPIGNHFRANLPDDPQHVIW